MCAKRYGVLIFFLLVFLAVGGTGCVSVEETAPVVPTATLQPTEPSVLEQIRLAAADAPREIAPSVDANLLDQQVAANNDFAFDLYQSLRQQDGNLVYSPYSISTALAMAYAGARGETEAQMSRALHYVLPQEQLHPAFNLLDQTLTDPGDGDDDFQLSVANSLWGQEQYPFLPDFLDLLARNYGAGIHLVDFTSDDSRETARQAINAWVSQQTNARIKNLLAKGTLTDGTRLVLVNAIYAKGEWVNSFNDTSPNPFTLLDEQQVDVPTMSRRSNTYYFIGDGCQAVVLSYRPYYQHGRAEMIIVMPDPGTFAAFEQDFIQDALDRILNGLDYGDVELYLPKFEFGYSLELRDSLVGMGMPEAFAPFDADFSGMYDRSNAPGNLAISNVVHQAFVLVDEDGTEAAAATGIVMTQIVELVISPTEPPPLEIHIDHPFIFLIRDPATGSILFMGRVLDPRVP